MLPSSRNDATTKYGWVLNNNKSINSPTFGLCYTHIWKSQKWFGVDGLMGLDKCVMPVWNTFYWARVLNMFYVFAHQLSSYQNQTNYFLCFSIYHQQVLKEYSKWKFSTSNTLIRVIHSTESNIESPEYKSTENCFYSHCRCWNESN